MLTPKECAARLDTDPKAFRRFLRSITTEHPGKGRKWSIDDAAFDALAERYAAYTERKGRTVTIDDLADED